MSKVKLSLAIVAALAVVLFGWDYLSVHQEVSELAQQHATKETGKFGANVPHSTTNITGGHTNVDHSNAGFESVADKILFDGLYMSPFISSYLEFDDFIGAGEDTTGAASITTTGHTFGKLRWRASFTGTGAGVSFVSTAQDSTHLGIVQLDRGTTATGTCAMVRFPSGVAAFTFGTGQTITTEWDFRIPALSDGTNTYVAHVGYMDTAVAAPANEVAVEYSSGAPSSGNFICRTCAASSCTTAAGGSPSTVTAAANTWYRATITWDGTTAGCKINGTNIGTTSSTIPTAAVGDIAHITGSAGTSSRTLLVDAYASLPVWSPTRFP